MSEFKFSCPHCDQHMLVPVGYAGAQLNCPACQKLIVVPAAPGAASPPPPLAGPKPLGIQRPPAPVTSAPPASAPAAPRPAAYRTPLPPAQKSGGRGLRTAVIFSAILLVCAALGAGGWYFSQQNRAKENLAVQVPVPTAATAAGAQEILAKVQQAYTNLTSLSVMGTSTGVMDISAVTAADLNPNQSAADKNATLKAAQVAKAVTNLTEVSIKLARPDLYQIEGVSKMAVGQIAGVNFTIAIWTAGGTNFALLGKNFAIAEDRREAFLKTAAMGKLASAIPQLFFGEANAWAGTKNWGQTEDESLAGQNCYTLTAKVMGQKLKIWVSKTSCLILQSQITIGGALSDADINDAFDTPDMKANYTPEQIDAMKTQTKLKSAMMAKIRGNITETYADIQTNENLTSEDFIYAVPRGVRLNSTPLKFGSNYVISADMTAPGASTETRWRNACINNLRQIDAAKNQFALEQRKKTGDPVTEDDIKPYVKLDADGNLPKCPAGGKYVIGKVGENPTCSIDGHVLP